MNVMFPMYFRLTTPKTHRRTFSGVLEFTAEEECCYLPGWMMRHLILEEGDTVILTNVLLPKATEITIRPYETRFTQLSNPKAVLEETLKHYACLSKGDTIALQYNGEVFEFDILETQPEQAVGIIDADVRMNFSEPRDYKEFVEFWASGRWRRWRRRRPVLLLQRKKSRRNPSYQRKWSIYQRNFRGRDIGYRGRWWTRRRCKK
eukprot:TRINITY_DN1732_c0_g1_i1.p2 TRINITY_DN1732_c0_g1~~TRINITY_DN1732_c0_g1_i1.p2  ORF type:complete len:205 (+),score=51.18 TRINITY_DN1732_c0_g1_i1:259-873(+)